MINPGISFGLLPGLPNWIFIILILGLGITAVLPAQAGKMRELWGRVGIVLIIAGGAGNLVSRSVNGGVVDNLAFFGLFYNNVWDYLIVSGVIVYLFQIWRNNR